MIFGKRKSAMKTLNPKFEARNPKQIRSLNPNDQTYLVSNFLPRISILFRISKFAFRICASFLTVLTCACLALAGDDSGRKITFAGAKVGELPTGWKIAKTGKGTGGDWKVVADKDAPGRLALGQTKADKAATFNLCVLEGAKYKDLDLTVSFKAMAGDTDQGGGLVWRLRDGDNYYVARVNPLEDNFRLYKVEAGSRKQLATADVLAAAEQWHTLRIVQRGNHIECYLNGKKYLDAKDDAFAGAGKIGLWSKADAQTRFAGLIVKGKKS
jgi:hypothetical protein